MSTSITNSARYGTEDLGSWGVQLGGSLTCAWLIHWSTRSPLVLVGVVALDAGQVGYAVVPSHHEDESQHDTHPEVDALVRHGGYHFPRVFTRVIALNAAQQVQQSRKTNKQKDGC